VDWVRSQGRTPALPPRLRNGHSAPGRLFRCRPLPQLEGGDAEYPLQRGEILGMRWSEIDLDKKIWTVPADRMKAGREHRVPLSPRAAAILRQLEKLKTGDFVFAGQARNKPLSNMAMEMVTRRMKIEGATVHGFRSSLRDWAGNVSSFPREVVETALAHVIGDKVDKHIAAATRWRSGAS
jgi:integrase